MGVHLTLASVPLLEDLKILLLDKKILHFYQKCFTSKKFLNCNNGPELLVSYGNLYFEYIELKKLFFYIHVCMRFLIFPPDFGFIHRLLFLWIRKYTIVVLLLYVNCKNAEWIFMKYELFSATTNIVTRCTYPYYIFSYHGSCL